MSAVLEAIGERLKAERNRLGYNQIDFAEKAGVNVNSIRFYEGGKRAANVMFLMILQDLGCDIGYILTGKHGSGALPFDEEQLLMNYRKCSNREKYAFGNMLHNLVGEEITLESMNIPIRRRRSGDLGEPVE